MFLSFFFACLGNTSTSTKHCRAVIPLGYLKGSGLKTVIEVIQPSHLHLGCKVLTA